MKSHNIDYKKNKGEFKINPKGMSSKDLKLDISCYEKHKSRETIYKIVTYFATKTGYKTICKNADDGLPFAKFIYFNDKNKRKEVKFQALRSAYKRKTGEEFPQIKEYTKDGIEERWRDFCQSLGLVYCGYEIENGKECKLSYSILKTRDINGKEMRLRYSNNANARKGLIKWVNKVARSKEIILSPNNVESHVIYKSKKEEIMNKTTETIINSILNFVKKFKF